MGEGLGRSSSSSWPGLSRPSTSCLLADSFKDVDARDKPGHDDEESFLVNRSLRRLRLRTPLHRKLGLEACEIAVDRSHRKHPAFALVFQQAILRGDIAVDGDFVPLLGVADIIDRHIVMLAPEERHGIEGLALAQ